MSFGLLLGASSAAAAVTCVRMGLLCIRLPKIVQEDCGRCALGGRDQG